MLCFFCSQYDHLWHQMCSSLGLCPQSHQYLKVHCILCVLLLKQQMVEPVKSFLRRGMIFARTSWYSCKTFLHSVCMLAIGYLCTCGHWRTKTHTCHVLWHTHKLYLMNLEMDVQEKRVCLHKYLSFCRLFKWYR